jgi:hypothetical protein
MPQKPVRQMYVTGVPLSALTAITKWFTAMTCVHLFVILTLVCASHATKKILVEIITGRHHIAMLAPVVYRCAP